MTKLNEKRNAMARQYISQNYHEGSPAHDIATGVFIDAYDAALAEVMPMMREMAEKSRSLGHAVVMGQKEDIIFATKELSDVLNKYSELVEK